MIEEIKNENGEQPEDALRNLQVTNKIVVITIIILFTGLILCIISMSGRLNPQDGNLLANFGSGIFISALFVLLTEYYFKRILETQYGNINLLLNEKKSTESQFESIRKRLAAKVEEGIRIHTHVADLNIDGLIIEAKKEVMFFGLSARNIMAPRTKEIILEKVTNVNDGCKFKLLLLNTWGTDFADARNEMMDVSPHRNYLSDINTAGSAISEITQCDPAHKKIDIRFYSLIPTTYFFIIDNKLFVSFLLNKPVAKCPLIEIEIDKHPRISQIFIDHFNHYWNNSKFFVGVIGFHPNSHQFLMVYNRKRNGWEWPRGYIEPGENPETTAGREFEEETGYKIKDIRLIHETLFGTFYSGTIGEKKHGKSTREVLKMRFCKNLPSNISFPHEKNYFEDILRIAIDNIKIKKR